MSDINVSIVLFNTEINQLNRCIDSIKKSNNINTIFLIDNSEFELNLEILNQPEKINIDYIHNSKNLGYGRGHNLAIKKSLESNNIKYHLVINADVFFEENIIDICYEFMQQNNRVGNVVPNVMSSNNEHQYPGKLIPNPIDLLIRFFVPRILSKNHERNYALVDYHKDNKNFFAPFLTGCYMFLRISTLREVGIFDERFFLYPEDIDLSRRIANNCDQIVLNSHNIIHQHGRAYDKSFSIFIVMLKNMVKYFNKWGWFNDKIRLKLNKKAQIQKVIQR